MAESTVASSRSAPTTRPRSFTRDEYLRMAEVGILTEDDPVELIHGQIVEMSPENTPHRAAIMKLNRMLVEALDPERYAVQPQSTLPLDDHNVPEPDVAVLRGTPDDLMQGELPAALVVEVADTSLEHDRTVKQELYTQAEVPVYWIVNLTARELEVYSDPGDDRYREHSTRSDAETVTLPTQDGETLTVRDLLPETGGPSPE
ncbi:MAG: Uma2 family endonuclease [Bacteroidetes bacterium SW_9_63_38]|nr:MAG: Uma2 family endonuclease [Bacteroidetes bacterium SW_9_63_38]